MGVSPCFNDDDDEIRKEIDNKKNNNKIDIKGSNRSNRTNASSIWDSEKKKNIEINKLNDKDENRGHKKEKEKAKKMDIIEKKNQIKELSFHNDENISSKNKKVHQQNDIIQINSNNNKINGDKKSIQQESLIKNINDTNELKIQNKITKIKNNSILEKNKDDNDNKYKFDKPNKMNGQIHLEEFYFLDSYKPLKNMSISKEDNNDDNFVLIFYKHKDLKRNKYLKKDFIDNYKFIYIKYKEKTLRFLFAKYKYNKEITEEDIMKEIKESFYLEILEKQFNIHLNSKTKKYFLTKIINSDNKYNLNEGEKNNKNEVQIIGFSSQLIKNIDNNDEDNKNTNQINNKTIKKKDNKENIENINNNTHLAHDNKQINNSNENHIKNQNNNILKHEINDIDNNINNNENENIGEENNEIIKNDNDINTKIEAKRENKKHLNVNNNIIDKINSPKIKIYYFPLVGLNNVGATCFMNAILQCLIHIPELSMYFLKEYPKDKQLLYTRNAQCKTQGHLSEAYYNLLEGVDTKSKQEIINFYSSYFPKNFKEILGKYNPQFVKYEPNDSKDLILYLLQTFHEELNYFGNIPKPNNIPQNPTSREHTYTSFNLTYNSTNLSKISQLFYGTYENIIICNKCNTKYYSYQKFEYISFSTYKYTKATCKIMNGFEDLESKQKLEGENQYFCQKCKKLENADIYCKLLELPNYLILNLDYGKDKEYEVGKLVFEYEIDLKKYLSIDLGQKSKYKLVSICTHIGKSGPKGHYVAYCLNQEYVKWYKFDDSTLNACDKYELNKDSPYILVYELI